MNRGSDLPNLLERPEPDASMRPRFMNRGSYVEKQMAEMRNGASMRPRFMNRGSRASEDAIRTACDGFNEAPIHESGK